jgi:hypothetical protein
VASSLIEREVGRVHLYRHLIVDFRRVYWTPPLSAREVYRLETAQIEQQLHMAPLVSLTDHDNIEAGLHLSMLQETAHVPVSVEWSAPVRWHGVSSRRSQPGCLPSKFLDGTVPPLHL